MSRLSILSSLLVLLACLFPYPGFACVTGPNNTIPTAIDGVSPQVGIAGVTQVYIYGTCFGTEHGDGTGVGYITVGADAAGNPIRIPDSNISYWSDAEIVFQLPFDVTTGDLVVHTQYATQDDTANAASYCSEGSSWCGNGSISPNFQVQSPGSPPFTPLPPGTWPCPQTSSEACPRILGSESSPQYVAGTWDYDDGMVTGTLTLAQGAQNSDGTWPLSGSFDSNQWGSQAVSGTLDQEGDIIVCIDNCQIQSAEILAEWRVLSSGDVTTNGYWNDWGCYAMTGSNLLDIISNWADPPIQNSQCSPPPLFKVQTDQPTGETPAAVDWVELPGSTIPTYGQFERTLPLSTGGFNEFASRFVFEQSAGAAVDGCYWTGSNYSPVTAGLSGGGWYATPGNQWGLDTIGISSVMVTYYQDQWGPKGITCAVGVPQAMFINARTGPSQTAYTTNYLIRAMIAPKSLLTGVEVQDGAEYTECENYPSLKGKCH